MADKKFIDFTTATTPSSNDFALVANSANGVRKTTLSNLVGAVTNPNAVSIANIGDGSVNGAIADVSRTIELLSVGSSTRLKACCISLSITFTNGIGKADLSSYGTFSSICFLSRALTAYPSTDISILGSSISNNVLSVYAKADSGTSITDFTGPLNFIALVFKVA